MGYIKLGGFPGKLEIRQSLQQQQHQFESENVSIVVGLGCTCCLLHRDDPSVYLLASYPARYENQNVWQAFLLLYIPSLTLWFIVVCNDNVITWVPSVWGLYEWLSLVPIIGVKAKRICSLIWPGCLEDDPLPNSAPCCCLTHLKRKVKTESSYFSWPSK